MILPIPIGDEPNPPKIAWATYGLMGVNVFVYLLITLPQQGQPALTSDPSLVSYLRAMSEVTHLAPQKLLSMTSQYDLTLFRFGFRPSAPSIVALFCSQFLHAGFFHLAGNMLYLYIFGDNVEACLGRTRFLLVYLSTGILATLFYSLARYDSTLPLLGASGAISGVLGCYYVWFPFNRVRMLLIIFVFITTVTVPARLMLLFYIVVENLLPFLHQSPAGGGVAYGAHIGGFLSGAIYALLRGTNGQPHEKQSPSFFEDEDIVAKAKEGLKEKPLDVAAALYQKLSSEQFQTLDVQTVFIFVDRLTQAHQFDLALEILERLIQHHRGGSLQVQAKAHMRAGLIEWRGKGRDELARNHFQWILHAGSFGDTTLLAQQALDALN